MATKQKFFRRTLRHATASALVIAVFVGPLVVSGWFLLQSVIRQDPRLAGMTPMFHTRMIDMTGSEIIPFAQPVITVTFDDADESIYRQAFPMLQRDGIHSTQYVPVDLLADDAFMSITQLQAMEASGHEIASQGMTHRDLTTLSSHELTYEIATSSARLRSNFIVAATDFAPPYGSYNAYTLATTNEYYRSQKIALDTIQTVNGVANVINLSSSFTPRNFVSFAVQNDTKISDIQKLIDVTIANNGWLVLTYHDIDTSGRDGSVSPLQFADQIELISKSPIRVMTVRDFITAAQRKEKP